MQMLCLQYMFASHTESSKVNKQERKGQELITDRCTIWIDVGAEAENCVSLHVVVCEPYIFLTFHIPERL